MARFSSFKKIIYLSCSIATLSLFSDGAIGAEDLDEIPDEMRCSISMSVMEDPVITADGY